MKILFHCFIFFLIIFKVKAQDPVFDSYLEDHKLPQEEIDTVKAWHLGGGLNINFTQTYLRNWLPGGQSSVANTNLFTGYAMYTKGNIKWVNILRLAYGYIYLIEEDNFTKIDDQIEFNSTFSKKAFERFWYWAAVLTVRTQFTQGFDPNDETLVVSDFAAPLFGFLGIGLEYSPNENFSVLLAPIALKVTVVTKEELSAIGAYGVEPGETVRYEFGAFARAYYFKDEVAKSLDFQFTGWAFYGYLDNPDNNVDFNLQLVFLYAIKPWLQTSLNIDLFYDNDFGEIVVTPDGQMVEPGKLQIKEVFTLGIALKF